MKLFTKICLIAAAVVGVLGIVGVGLGIAMGADAEDLREFEKQGIYLVPGESVVRVPDSSYTRGWNSTYGWEYDCDNHNITKLDLEIAQGEIYIFVSDDDSRTNDMISWETNNKNIRFGQDGNTLEIESSEHGFQDFKMNLYLPLGCLREIDMEFGGAAVTIDALEAEEVSLSVGAGTISINRLDAYRKADLQVGAGELIVSMYSGDELEVECGMGNAYILCEGEPADYNYSLECGMGNIAVGDNNYSGVAQGLKLDNKAAKRIDAECGMGNITLEYNGAE